MNWNDFKYFTEDEFRPPGYDGEVSMSLGFMLKLEAMRSQLGSSFVIHRNGGFAVAGHADNSLHYAGLAADLHICKPAVSEPLAVGAVGVDTLFNALAQSQSSSVKPPSRSEPLAVGAVGVDTLFNTLAQSQSSSVKPPSRSEPLAVEAVGVDTLFNALAQSQSSSVKPPSRSEPRDVIEQALLAWKWSFLSIGIYPYWKQPGLHLDDRTAVGLEKTVWFQDRDGKYHYYPYNEFYRCLGDLIRYQQEVDHEQTAHV